MLAAADWRVLVLILILVHKNSTLRWPREQKEAPNRQLSVNNGTVFHLRSLVLSRCQSFPIQTPPDDRGEIGTANLTRRFWLVAGSTVGSVSAFVGLLKL